MVLESIFVCFLALWISAPKQVSKKSCHLSNRRCFSSCFFHRTSLLCLESFFRCFLTFKFSHKRGYPWPAIAFALMAIFISFWISCNFPNMSFSWAVFLIEHLLCASTFTFGLFLEFEVQPRNCQFCLFTKGHFLNF